jgi:hypothetical protein
VNEEHQPIPNIASDGTGDVEQPPQTIADAAVQHTLDLSADLIWDGEDCYVVVQEHGDVRTLALRSNAFKRWLISKMRAHGVKTPSSHQQWQAIIDILESRAAESGTKPTPSIRVAGKSAEIALDGSVAPPAVYIDVGDESWHCVRITAEGWEVIAHPADGPSGSSAISRATTAGCSWPTSCNSSELVVPTRSSPYTVCRARPRRRSLAAPRPCLTQRALPSRRRP